MESVSKIIIFQLKNQEYGANIHQIRSIERLQDVVALPQSANFVKGVINLRGRITPIIDLKLRMEMEETENTDSTRVLIASIDNIEVGLIVDSATDVLDIDPNLIEDTPEIIGGVKTEYLSGVAKLNDRLLLLLDLEHVLAANEMDEVKQALNA